MSHIVEPVSSIFADLNSDETAVIRAIVYEVVEALDIKNHEDSDIIRRLLKTTLQHSLSGRAGTLNNYYNNKLKKLLPSIYENFDLKPEEIDIDINHEPNSKLYSIIKAIKKRYDIDSPKRSSIPDHFGKKDSGMPCESNPNSGGLYGPGRY